MSQILAIVAKDLRIESRAKVVFSQVLPFALIVVVLFGFALDADKETLRSFTPGLFWVTVLFASVLAIQRSVAVEVESDAFEGLRLSGISGSKLFLGKALSVAVQLLVIEAVLIVAVIVLYRASIDNVLLAVVTLLLATVAIAAAGSLYGVLSVGLGVRDTILPLMLLPVLAPVLVGATRAFDDAFGTAALNGWTWVALLAVFALFYTVAGAASYGLILEDA